MFENVNYDFYKTTLGRSAIPDKASFNEYVIENELFVKQLINDSLIVEREKKRDRQCSLYDGRGRLYHSTGGK